MVIMPHIQKKASVWHSEVLLKNTSHNTTSSKLDMVQSELFWSGQELLKLPRSGGVEQQSRQPSICILDAENRGNKERNLSATQKKKVYGTERRWVANLLGNERAVQPLLKYLMATEVGSREGGAERAAEWDERVDQEGEELRNQEGR